MKEESLNETQGKLKNNLVKNGAEQVKVEMKVMVSESEELKKNQVKKWEGTEKGWAANAKVEAE